MDITLTPKVADRIGRAFPQRALLLGIEWFRTGGVEVESITDDAVEAAVKGKRLQKVQLAVAAAGKALATSCSCHASSLGGAVCSHVWAVVLEIDRRGALERLRTTRALARVVPMPVEPANKPAKKGAGAGAGAEVRPKAEVAAARDRPSRRSPRATDAPPEAQGGKRRRRPRS